MTEAEWLVCNDPEKMWQAWTHLAFVENRDRKSWLFACACCRRVLPLVTLNPFRQALDFIERYIEGLETDEDANNLDIKLADLFYEHFSDNDARRTTKAQATIMIHELLAQDPPVGAEMAFNRVRWLDDCEAGRFKGRVFLCELLRDLHGPVLFRPVAVAHSWLTSTVLALATGIYAENAFDRMPILADALQDTGCGKRSQVMRPCINSLRGADSQRSVVGPRRERVSVPSFRCGAR